MHLTVAGGLVAVTKELSSLAQAQTCHSCSQDISTEMCAWLAPPVLGPQAIYNISRNVCHDLTPTSYIPIGFDSTECDIM